MTARKWLAAAVGAGLWLVAMIGMYWLFDVLPLVLVFALAVYYAVLSGRRTESAPARARDGTR